MALQGTLDTFALPDVLRLLAATKKSGRLRITGARGTGSTWVLDGGIAGIEADHAPHATEPVDALFELLRFEEGSFAFDADVTTEAAGSLTEVEELLARAEALLDEWRQIEAVVPSLDAHVTMRRILEGPAVSIAQEQWTALVAVGSGSTVRRIADELSLAEIPVSRAVKELVELGVVDIEAAPAEAPPATAVAEPPPIADAVVDTEGDAPDAGSTDSLDGGDGAAPAPDGPVAPEASPVTEAATDGSPGDDDVEALPAARPLRARRSKAPAPVADGPKEPERFVSIELPGNLTSGLTTNEDGAGGHSDEAIDDLAAAFPGLANRTTPPTPEDEELARQLATLSPRAAEAVRAAAEAATDEERDAALDEADDGEDAPINRGLLLKFLSSVKS